MISTFALMSCHTVCNFILKDVRLAVNTNSCLSFHFRFDLRWEDAACPPPPSPPETRHITLFPTRNVNTMTFFFSGRGFSAVSKEVGAIRLKSVLMHCYREPVMDCRMGTLKQTNDDDDGDEAGGSECSWGLGSLSCLPFFNGTHDMRLMVTPPPPPLMQHTFFFFPLLPLCLVSFFLPFCPFYSTFNPFSFFFFLLCLSCSLWSLQSYLLHGWDHIYYVYICNRLIHTGAPFVS